MRIRTAGVQFMRDNPERFIESNTKNSWLRYLNNMSIQATWADALIIQTVADVLQSKQVKRSSHEWIQPRSQGFSLSKGKALGTRLEWINKFIIANLISVIISIICSSD